MDQWHKVINYGNKPCKKCFNKFKNNFQIHFYINSKSQRVMTFLIARVSFCDFWGFRNCLSHFRLSVKSSVSAFFGRQYERIRAKETTALFYALASGIMMTMYSTFYKVIKDKMDKNTVLTLRGFIQVTFL